MIKTGVVILKSLFSSERENLDLFTHESHFRVYPWHLDLNRHVNNATYLRFCNQARLEYLAKSGLIKFLLKLRVNPILVKNEIHYKKSLKLFDYFSVKTKLLEVSEKEVVLEHQIIRKDTLISECKSHARLFGKAQRSNQQLLEEFAHEKE